MVFVIHRTPRPGAVVWPGRRLLAVIDAVLYPVLFVMLLRSVHVTTGVIGLVAMGAAVALAVSRVGCALLRNERYRFVTWRLGRVGLPLLVLGFAIKAAIHWGGG